MLGGCRTAEDKGGRLCLISTTLWSGTALCMLAGLDRPLTVYLILNIHTKILHRTENAYISWH